MKIAVVTTFNERLYQEYGRRFIDTYNWPFDLFVYSEDMSTIPNAEEKPQNITLHNMYDKVPECKHFVDRNKHRSTRKFILANGFRTLKRFIYDGVMFCYKVYAYTDMIITNKGYDSLIFIDADSVFYKPIDVDWIANNIHKEYCMMAYLGRTKPTTTETGFIYFNLQHADSISYATTIQNMYNKDLIYQEKEYHDGYIFDVVRESMESSKGTKNYNLGDNNNSHVQAYSVLGEIYDHTKGKRKKSGRSPESKIGL